jgi:nitrite reductase/ring-hydroxylating ferredoxin subunit
MSRSIKLIDTATVPPDGATEVVAEGRIFAVFQSEGEYFAIDGICAHAGGPLGQGKLEGRIVTCPWHGWQYDVSTGRNCLNEAICQTPYPVSVRDNAVWIELPDEDSGQAKT